MLFDLRPHFLSLSVTDCLLLHRFVTFHRRNNKMFTTPNCIRFIGFVWMAVTFYQHRWHIIKGCPKHHTSFKPPAFLSWQECVLHGLDCILFDMHVITKATQNLKNQSELPSYMGRYWLLNYIVSCLQNAGTLWSVFYLYPSTTRYVIAFFLSDFIWLVRRRLHTSEFVIWLAKEWNDYNVRFRSYPLI